ncbi:MAG TPA: PD-(D/E)XK nuclease family protein, partial [Vicinamibacterales bacterium]|nr:PD-(D/E)XK nuclease family protein [Vicinamibacterales bacterium]
GSLRVLDYKASVPIEPIQLAVYAVTAAQRLSKETRRTWRIGEAAYVVYGGRRGVRPLERRGESLAEALRRAERRFIAAIDAIAAGEFPVRPVQTRLCASCAYDGVCRKEYVNESDADDDATAV